MIGFIAGEVIAKLANSLVVRYENTGWEIHTNVEPFAIGDTVEFFIHTNVRENEISLWGFKESSDLSLFRMLIGVSGIGAKTAYTLIEEKGSGLIKQSIVDGDEKGLKVSGVGKKTAEKIILELRDKVDALPSASRSGVGEQVGLNDNTALFEAKDALVSLGYAERDVESAVQKIEKTEVESSSAQDLVKLLLQRI